MPKFCHGLLVALFLKSVIIISICLFLEEGASMSMKILALADQESSFLWDYFDKDYVRDIDLILSCGDLKASYLSFMATLCKAPVLYIHGNHDARYRVKPPEGCVCIEDTIYTYHGIRILGLGGSICYNYGPYQYTQEQMNRRVSKLRFQIYKNKGFDILLTHAPAAGCGDGTDLAHCGFTAFADLMHRYQPSYMVHGHMHANYCCNFKRQRTFEHTTVVNAYEKYIFEI